MEPHKSSRGLIIGITIAILAVAGVIVFALSNQNQPTTSRDQTQTATSSEPATTQSDSTAAPGEQAVIAFTDQGFEPAELSVKKGTVITVTNKSTRDVQFSSADHPTHRENTEMNLKTLSAGESATYTATKTGEWGYHDHIDETKTGTVTVTEQ